MPYRANPFFAPTTTFFAPSVGDKIDQAVDKAEAYTRQAQAKAQAYANQAQGKGQELLQKAELKAGDAKEAVKVAASPAPTGVDLYARCVVFLSTSRSFGAESTC